MKQISHYTAFRCQTLTPSGAPKKNVIVLNANEHLPIATLVQCSIVRIRSDVYFVSDLSGSPVACFQKLGDLCTNDDQEIYVPNHDKNGFECFEIRHSEVHL